MKRSYADVKKENTKSIDETERLASLLYIVEYTYSKKCRNKKGQDKREQY